MIQTSAKHKAREGIAILPEDRELFVDLFYYVWIDI